MVVLKWHMQSRKAGTNHSIIGFTPIIARTLWILLEATIQPLATFTDRVLHSNNIRQVTNYIQIKHRMLTACNAFERGNQLAQTDNRHDFAERLDADVLRCSLSTEKRIRKYKEPAWSIELAEARKKVSILNKSLSMARTNIDHTEIIQRDMNKLATPILYPESVEECSTELRKAKREVSEIISRSFKTRRVGTRGNDRPTRG